MESQVGATKCYPLELAQKMEQLSGTGGVFKCEMFLKPGELVNGGPQVAEGDALCSWMGIVYPDGSIDAVTTGTPEDWLPDDSKEDRELRLKLQLYSELVRYFGTRHLKAFGVDRGSLRQSVINV